MSETRDIFDDAPAERVNVFIDRYSTASIMRATAMIFGITYTEIMSSTHEPRVAIPRMMAMYLARKLTLRSLPQIGRACGRDHTTVLSADRRIADLAAKSPALAAKIETITRYLETGYLYDLVAHIDRQRAFSRVTFGPGMRTQGVCDHIRKELAEVQAQPGSLEEWIDVVLLALDGAQRTGATSAEICKALEKKQTTNEHRTWPDWRKAPRDRAIEHIRPETEDNNVPSA